MVKSIIIGCNGYLGRNLAWFLKSMGETVVGYDISNENQYDFPSYHQLDICNLAQVMNSDFRADYIYVFAGRTGTKISLDEPFAYINANEIGLLNILENVKHIDCPPRIIFPSTRLVYKGSETELLTEQSTLEPLTIYAVNKIACENLLCVYHRSFKIEYQAYRIGVPFGSFINGARSYGTIGSFINQAQNIGKISLFGSGILGRTFSSIFDICKKMYLNRDLESGIFNMGGQNLNLLDLALLISNKFNVPIENVEWPSSILNLESGSTIFDGSKLDRVTYYGQNVQIDEWINSGCELLDLQKLID